MFTTPELPVVAGDEDNDRTVERLTMMKMCTTKREAITETPGKHRLIFFGRRCRRYRDRRNLSTVTIASLGERRR